MVVNKTERYIGIKDEQVYEYSSDIKTISYKYREDQIIEDFKKYIDSTYNEHYHGEDRLTCFDAWIALGDATPTFRNTAMKYLWRLGKKKDNFPKNDLMKTMHYVLMCLYNEYYKPETL
jgi:hypothetical protein